VDGKRSFALMRWGMLPAWVKDPKTFPLLINARGESVLEKPAFRNAMRYRRCLIPNDGFYEWQPGATKRPYLVRAKRDANGEAQPLAFAGLYETWTGPNGEELDTVAIITTRANHTLSAIHDRMPVFVPPQVFDLWLDCRNVEAELLEAYEISTAVNRVANDSAALLEPMSAEAPRIAPPASPEAFAKEKKPRARRVKEPDGQASLF
jgi:putative SOS response-associated peptidase YedK